MKILIPGGAGYIGSHMVLALQELNHEVTVLDDFSTGHKWSLNNCETIELNLMDSVSLKKAMKGRSYDCVIHFAAKSIVSESFKNPIEYYKNNVLGTMNLVNEMLLNDINNLEALMLITLAILVILFGFYPSPLMDTLNISVNNLINNYEIAIRANGLN